MSSLYLYFLDKFGMQLQIYLKIVDFFEKIEYNIPMR